MVKSRNTIIQNLISAHYCPTDFIRAASFMALYPSCDIRAYTMVAWNSCLSGGWASLSTIYLALGVLVTRRTWSYTGVSDRP